MTERTRDGGTIVLGVLSVLAILGLLASIVVATREMSLGDGLRDVAATWWGIVTLADLGVGLLFVALWMAMVERRVWPTAAWIVAVFMLGNFTTAVYLLVRCVRYPTLREVVLGAPRSESR